MSRPTHRLHQRLRRPLVATAVCTALVLASCGKAHNDQQAGNAEFAVAAPTATSSVGSVTWNLPQEPASLDPVKVFNSSDMTVSANICEALLAFSRDGELEPNLATSIDTPNPLTYVVHLRSGVTFSDGHPMTAQDVVFSLDRVMDPKSGSYWSGFATNVDKVTATNSHTVTITMKRPDAVFYRMLATPMGQVVERAAAQKAGSSFGSATGGIVCTGPYTLASWKKGDSITLAANPRWWDAADHPQLTRQITFTFVASDSTLASALTNGDVDGTFIVPGGGALTKLTHAANGQLYVGPSTSQLVLVPTQLTGSSALANPLVRQALADSIDYKGILSTIYGPTGAPLRAIVPPGAFGYAQKTFQDAYDALPQPSLDITAAKKLLAQAGDPHPTVTIGVPSSVDTFVNIAEAIQSSAKQAGFNVKIKSMSDADFYPLYSSAKARQQVDAFITDWYVDIPDPLELYMQIGTPGSAADFGGYDNKHVTSLLNQARQTLDDQKRAELVVKAQATITKDQVWIPMAYELGTMFLSNKLGGVTSASPYNDYAPWAAGLGAR
jgi:peptide/nickel transport system substrate-binding protein